MCRRSGACRLQYGRGGNMLQTKLCQIFFHLDHHIIPYPQYCHVYNANMVERNWICFGIWSSHAENLEVSESVPLWSEFSNMFKYCEHKLDTYNRGCLSLIADMNFHFLAIWAAQGIAEKN